MKSFKELVTDVNDKLNAMVTKDTPTETIDAIKELKVSIENLDKSHDKLMDDYSSIKDKYIDAVTHTGNTSTPESKEDEDTSLEAIATKILAKGGK